MKSGCVSGLGCVHEGGLGSGLFICQLLENSKFRMKK